jgi:hypothetical protein
VPLQASSPWWSPQHSGSGTGSWPHLNTQSEGWVLEALYFYTLRPTWQLLGSLQFQLWASVWHLGSPRIKPWAWHISWGLLASTGKWRSRTPGLGTAQQFRQLRSLLFSYCENRKLTTKCAGHKTRLSLHSTNFVSDIFLSEIHWARCARRNARTSSCEVSGIVLCVQPGLEHDDEF